MYEMATEASEGAVESIGERERLRLVFVELGASG
jgi:hypothetical protein